MSFQATLRYASGVAIIDLQGRLVGADGGALRTLMLSAADSGHKAILLNCEALDSADSLGLGDLVATHASVVRRGGEVKLLKPHRRFDEILRITRIRNLFEIHDDEAKAVNSFSLKSATKARAALSDFQS